MEGFLAFRSSAQRTAWRGLVVLALAAGMAGCAESPKRVARVHPPVPPPTPQQTEPSFNIARLPLPPTNQPAALVAARRPGVDLVIEQVQGDFQQGEDDYRAERLPEARQQFDRAIHLLLSSGLNFSADPRLEPLLNQLVDSQHTYEENAQQEGLGAQTATEGQEQEEQNTQPTSPIEEIVEAPNLPVSPELDQKAASELLHVPHDLPLTLNDYVLVYLNFFQTTKGRKIIEHSLARSGRYSAMVRRVLHEEGLPLDLAYLPLPESGYQPRAMSRMGARGLWQFMPLRGKEYGLQINRWEDERMDPERSTRAAAEHLRDLYQMFHDWYLVLAAYDSGPLTVARAIERTGYADFWQLYRLNALPAETKNYVPIMLAMTLVAKDPTIYGVEVSDPEKPVPTDDFVPGQSIDLRLVADVAGTDLETLRSLNPELTGLVTPNDPKFTLRLPVGDAAGLRATLTSVPHDRWVGWRLHRAAAGETLDEVARQYHVRLASLAEANDLDAGDPLAPGQMLLVPAPVSRRLIYHRVSRGETLEDVADRFGVSSQDLRRWNRLRSSRIRPGMHLRIYTSEPSPSFQPVSSRRVSRMTNGGHTKPAREVTSSSHAVHIARSGETLWSIAREYHTTIDALREANPAIGKHGLETGERVVIPDE